MHEKTIPASLQRRSRILCIALFATVSSAFASATEEFSEVKKVIQAKSDAWEKGDAAAWGESYRDDSVLINIFGSRFPDRQENIERHGAIFEGIFRDTSLKVEFEQVQRLSDTLVLAESILSVTGYERLPEGVPETTPGVLQTRMTFILEKSADKGWQIIFAQNTAIVSQ